MTRIRTRFAPSPTGFVHVGSVRTALYNYLYARHHDGDYVLRIEDTDQTRKVDGAIENLIASMKTLGLEHDEGPDIGGSFGPYYQSQRLDLYRKHVQTMLENKTAYRCFCSAERLEEMRNEQKLLGLAPKYDGQCRALTWDESESRAQNEEFVIRMRVPDAEQIIVEDEIRGKVGFQCAAIDDQVLIKSDGFPTYHFANVVDDHTMGITHVIRGEEWLPSTPKHIILYQCLGWTPPVFAHLPLLLNPDRSKLSKRQGDVAVEDYLQAGYFEETLINFLALLGWHPSDNRELFSLQDLIREFSLERVSKAGAVFDREKLDWMNAHYLKHDLSFQRYRELIEHQIDTQSRERLGEEKLNLALDAIRPNLESLSDVSRLLQVFSRWPEEFDLNRPEVQEVMELETNGTLFSHMVELLHTESMALTTDEFKSHLKTIQKQHKIKGKALFMPMRIALSGTMHGPDLARFAEILGREEILRRLKMRI